VSPQFLAEKLLTNPEIEGFTFSGGEPMLQAAGLATLAQIARKKREVSIICYTGFTLEQLLQNPPAPGVSDLLSQIDVLIDGPYIATLNDERGLRGSANQRIHLLSDRLKGFDFEACPRTVEIHVLEGEALLVGVPSKAGLAGFMSFTKRLKRIPARGGRER
jgi:anaerobic ribonucleoside-triphosphate reductase activating protein